MSRQDRWNWFAARQQPRTARSAQVSRPRRTLGHGFAQSRRLHVEPLEDRRMLAVITVTSLVDNLFLDGEVSLREAIVAANTNLPAGDAPAGSAGADTILFDASLSGQTIGLFAELEITEALTIDATALAQNVTIDAQQNSRIFNITATTGDFTLAGLNLTGGRTTGDNVFPATTFSGGAIRSLTTGNLTIDQSTVSGNDTNGYYARGGGIFSSGAVTLTSSTVSGNSTAGYFAAGGGIFSPGNVTLTSSTVSGNSTTGIRAYGGGIYSLGVVTLTSSTVSGNSTTGNRAYGGGIFSFGAVTLTSSTVTDNHAISLSVTGGGIWNKNDVINITNSIVAGNTAGGGNPDIRHGTGTFTVNFSLLGSAVTPDAGGSGNLSSDTPLLGPLAFNGGPTETHALLTGSLAIDAGDPGFDVVATPNDQRGAPFLRGIGLRVDIGAYERQTLAGLNLTVDTILDENDGDTSPGNLSLREAVGLASGSVGADTITFDAAVFAAPQTILLSLGEIDISEAVTIDATALASNVTIDAQQNSRIFNIIATTGNFTLAGLMLTGGKTTGDNINFSDTSTKFSGGAVRSLTTGSLTLDQSTISGNSTTGNNADGGGIFSSGAVTFISSTVSGNSTAGGGAQGGGIFSSGAVTLTSSTVSGNSTAGTNGIGGGIRSGGNVTLTSSTVSGNSTTVGNARGGGIFSSGAVTLTSSTVSGNSAAGTNSDGGGIYSFGAVMLTSSTVSGNSTAGIGGGILNGNLVTITNSIVAGNTAQGGSPDIRPGTGTFDVNFSLIGDPSGTSLTATGGVPGANGNIVGGSPVDLQVSIDFAAFGDFEVADLFDLSYTIDGGSLQPLFTSSVDEAGSQSYTLEDGTVVLRNDPLLVNGTTLNNEFQTLAATIPGATRGASVAIVLVASTNGAGEAFVFRNIVVTELVSGSLVAQALVSGSDLNVSFTQDDPDYSINDDMFGIRSRTNPGTFGLPRPVVDDSLANPPDTDGIIRSTDTANFFGVADTFNGTGNDTNIARWTLLAPFNLLGPLADNGGPTATHALLPGSPAIDAGDPSIQFNANEYDQRGAPFVRVSGGRIDIGAVEDQPIADSADFDTDGDVDGSDFLAWQRGFGTPNANKPDGDANNDNDVDAVDLGIWETQFGQPAPVAAASELSAISDQPSTVLIDAAMATEWLGVASEQETVVVDEQTAVEAVFAGRFETDGFAPSAKGEVDLGTGHEDSSENSENTDEPWLADELLERVFG